MIDAGSTGSRIHIYKFNNCAASPSFEYEVFSQTRPGLSSYAAHPSQAAESLDVLMQEAERVVPRSLWVCTPVAVKATAGLRLLGIQESEAILTAVRLRLETKYKFGVAERNGVEIMDGKDEGVHAWVTANYLLDALPTGRTVGVPLTTPYAVLDLGGASTQIVFKPSFDLDGDGIDDNGNGLEEGEHKYVLHFQGGDHVLYQHSYLGYGLMRARAHVHRVVEFMSHFTSNTSPATKPNGDEEDEDEGEVVYNPCIAQGMKRRIEVDIGREGVSVFKNVTMMGGEVGSWEACNRVLELVLAKDAYVVSQSSHLVLTNDSRVCHLKPCSFNGVYQPSLMDSFPTGSILLLSYFYDRLAPLLTPSLPPPTTPSSPKLDPTESLVFPISTIKYLAQLVCGGENSWRASVFPFPLEGGAERDAPRGWAESREVLEELYGRPEWCLDLSFMYALLRLGYEFGEDRGVRIGKQVRGTELGWCLGATLGLLGNADFECRA
jgi:guanosine-diphosphatase